jgi:predicted enzyme related to lactoylglutathione lyase
MSAKLNHLAIVSEKYALSAKFYEAVFEMSRSEMPPEVAVAVTDGYVGLQFVPRRPGRAARLEHFGIQVDDIEAVYDRLRTRYQRVGWLKRPGNRTFAGVSAHDPDGNVFDLSQEGMENRDDVYTSLGTAKRRHIDHFGLRTMNPEVLAEFYSEVFGLELLEKTPGDRNYYVTDGQVTMVIMPWEISDFAGTGIAAPALDHVGFKVESLAKFNENLARVARVNPMLAPAPIAFGPEGEAWLALAKRSCPRCHQHLADVDGLLISVAEA